jgi:DNA-binding response OmpR family regulator
MKDKRHIFIVDDESIVIDVLQIYFEEKGFKVDVATDGVAALHYLEHTIPDIVITDLLLPGEHGVNLIKTIKEKYFLPVIIISGIYKQEELADVMVDNYVEGFFEKPVSLDILLKKVNAILNARTL